MTSPPTHPSPSWVRSVTAPNSGPMTLEGTNSWVLGTGRVVVIDPGPLDEPHLLELAMSGDVEQILLTHGHPDHSEGAQRLHQLTGAPVRGWDPRFVHGSHRLEAEERITHDLLTIRVLHTPGHTDDSVSFVVTGPDDVTALLTGDTILGRGSTVIAHPEGRLSDYLRTLDLVGRLGHIVVLPGHGPSGGSAVRMATEYLAHRRERLEQVRAAVAGGATEPHQVVDVVYADVPSDVRGAALLSVEAQLHYLQTLDEQG